MMPLLELSFSDKEQPGIAGKDIAAKITATCHGRQETNGEPHA
jgi:hypothetical protein